MSTGSFTKDFRISTEEAAEKMYEISQKINDRHKENSRSVLEELAYSASLLKGEKHMNSYRCPECGKWFTGDLWDAQTQTHYDEDGLMSIMDDRCGSLFNCLGCDAENDGGVIESNEREMVTITKDEYEELLEFKAMYIDLCG